MPKTALLTTAYLPPIDYLLLFAQHTRIAIDHGENYQKQSYRNRCEIITSQGTQALVVPVKRPNGNRTPIRDVLIDYDTDWQRLHLGAIHAAYAKSAYFIHYIDELTTIIRSTQTHLHELNAQLLHFLLRSFRLTCEMEYLTVYREHPAPNETDHRTTIHPKKTRSGNYHYYQTFSDRLPFCPNLSGIDLLLNEGPLGIQMVMRQLTPPAP